MVEDAEARVCVQAVGEALQWHEEPDHPGQFRPAQRPGRWDDRLRNAFRREEPGGRRRRTEAAVVGHAETLMGRGHCPPEYLTVHGSGRREGRGRCRAWRMSVMSHPPRGAALA